MSTTLETCTGFYRRVTAEMAWRFRARRRRRTGDERRTRVLRALTLSPSWILDVRQFQRKGS